MSQTVMVAALQMCSTPEVGENLEEAARLLERAARAGAALAVLPENFSFMGWTDTDKLAVAEPDGEGPVQGFLSRMARELQLWIVGGTTPLRRAACGGSAAAEPSRQASAETLAQLPLVTASEGARERVAAACLVFDSQGRPVARYDKMHLFDVTIPQRADSYRESASIAPGTRAVLTPTPAGLLGLSVCYDVRFPELYRRLAAGGAQCFSVPAAFTVPTGSAHWETLLRARAIENLCYVIAPAQSGSHVNGRRTYGDSLIVDYWGQVLARLPRGSGVVVAELDLDAQARVRRDFPVLGHRVL